MSTAKVFALVRWLTDEKVSVMPASAALNESSLVPGMITKMKWSGKEVYDVEILKLSCELIYKYLHVASRLVAVCLSVRA